MASVTLQILLMIGETLKCTDSIVGCFISCRRANDKFSVWIRDIEGDTGGILCKELKTSLGESISEARLEKHGASQSGKRGR